MNLEILVWIYGFGYCDYSFGFSFDWWLGVWVGGVCINEDIYWRERESEREGVRERECEI